MAQSVIIGGASTVSFGQGSCVVSAQWGYNPGKQDAYCLGVWLPNDTYTVYKPTETLSMTVYSPGTSYSVEPSSSCADANSTTGSITPVACGGSGSGVSGSWLVTGYNFSRDSIAVPGQESWSMSKWKSLTATVPSNAVEPKYVLRGIPQGQSDGETGITFTGTTVEGSSGSVSAGGIGKGNTMEFGQVASVGGGASPTSTDLGTGSATIPYTPLYIE